MLGGMDNSNRDSADNWPTQQLWTPTAGQGGNGGQVPNPPGGNDSGPGSGDPGPAGRGPRRPSHATRWGVGVAVAAVLVGGGAVALASAGSQASPSGQAATLNTVLSSADSPSAADITATAPDSSPSAAASNNAASNKAAPAGARPGAAVCARAAKRLRAASHPKVARRVGAVCRHRLARVRLLVRGIHGQFTYQTKKGAKTLAFERGTIQSVNGTEVTVAASDGTTWTWHLVGSTVVRTGGKKVDRSTLATGQRVFAGGPVVSGTDDARLIVIRPAAKAGGSGSSAPSSSSTPAS
jgi:hypothetical protein